MAAITKAELQAQLAKLQRSLAREKKRKGDGDDLARARDAQAATAEILRVIRRSPSDVQPVFDAIAASAMRLFKAWSVTVVRFDGSQILFGAARGALPDSETYVRAMFPQKPQKKNIVGRCILARDVIELRDAQRDKSAEMRKLARVRGFRSALTVPLLREGAPIGAIAVTRTSAGPFATEEVEVLQSFADQAVIAIENVRLFKETKEALERQTSTAEILKVISGSPTDVQPVFDAVAENSMRLLGALSATVSLRVGDALQLAAFTSTNPSGDDALKKFFPVSLVENPDTILAQAAIRGTPIPVSDTEGAHNSPTLREMGRQRGWRSFLAVPMLSKGAAIGIISVTRREAGTFSDHDIELLTTFADQAVIAIENVRLFNETKEALEHQTATSEVLRVISTSPTDVRPVLHAISESAARLCESGDAQVLLLTDGALRIASQHGSEIRSTVGTTLPLNRDSASARAVIDGKTVHVPDISVLPAGELEQTKKNAAENKWRSVLSVPLLREGVPVGALSARRAKASPFTPRQIALLQTFADQAVIAIENVRLFNETREALERQTATSEVLRVISSSPTDVQPVFDMIVKSAATLCDGVFSTLYQFDGELIHDVAHHNYTPEALEAERRIFPTRPTRALGSGRAILERAVVHIPDLDADPEYQHHALARAIGCRSGLWVPMLREGAPIGVINVERAEPEPFSDKQIDLLKTFADQAVIAIENVRLFNETKEALERQTATAEILKVIASSPSDVQPVFEAIVANAARLCDAAYSAVARFEGGLLHLAAVNNMSPEEAAAYHSLFPRSPGRHFIMGRTFVEGRVVHVEDIEADPEYEPRTLEVLKRAAPYRTYLGIPILRDGIAIGAIGCGRRDIKPFTPAQIELVQAFADQAVIAIENVRLFNETKEALERQTATAEILKVISSSPTDVQPVFDAIVQSCMRLFGGLDVALNMVRGNTFDRVAFSVSREARDETADMFPMPLSGESIAGRAMLRGELVHVDDLSTESWVGERTRSICRRMGFRSALSAPMMRERKAIGSIIVFRGVTGRFKNEQIALLQAFADQAVIAIENVRLFNETKEALERQTATAEILKVIAGSPDDVQPVFDSIVESAVRLCDAIYGAVLTVDDGMVHLRSTHTVTDEGRAIVEALFPLPLESNHLTPIAIRERRVIRADRLQDDPAVPESSRTLAAALGYHSLVIIPMRGEGRTRGAIAVTSSRPFTENQAELLQTFTDQAVIAIENVRLFNETKEALERQTATAEVLKVIAGSPDDVQPVLDAIAQSAATLFEPCAVTITMVEGGMIHWRAPRRPADARIQAVSSVYPLPLDPEAAPSAQAILEARIIEIPDTEAPGVPEVTRRAGRGGEFRSGTFVPLIRGGKGIGTIILTHETPGFRLQEKQLELVRSFADQAVIAIENARLFNETNEALERQTATAEILKVISESPTDVQPVFDAIVGSCTRLLACNHATLRLVKGDQAEFAASNSTQGGKTVVKSPMSIHDDAWPTSQAVLGREVVQIPDTSAEGVSVQMKQRGEQRGFRSLMVAPLLRDNDVVGTINVHRATPGRFTEKEVALLETFASQAVIALENVRLFNELGARNREVSEALERQTATAEILGVISASPSDVQPVLEAVVERAARLCGSDDAVLWLLEGEWFRLHARFQLAADGPQPGGPGNRSVRLDLGTIMGAAVLDCVPIQIEDLQNPPAGLYPEGQRRAIEMNHRTTLAVPLLREGSALGAILLRRKAVRPFTDKQIALLQTFANQAVIAIENARLFNETKEALERQTATAEILKVISGSPNDVQPVFDAISRAGAKLFEPCTCGMMMREGDFVHLRAMEGSLAQTANREALSRIYPVRFDPANSITSRAMAERCVIEVEDTESPPDDFPMMQAAGRAGGWRSVVNVPLLREGVGIGAIGLVHPQPGFRLTDAQRELLKTFADQAVIAIENVRLFNETKEALERQTATAEILKVISESPTDVQPVFDAIAQSGLKLFPGALVSVALRYGDTINAAAVAAPDLARAEAWRRTISRTPLARNYMHGAALLDRRIVDIPDVADAPAEFVAGSQNFLTSGNRAITIMPMMRGDEAIGLLSVVRLVLGPLSDKQIAILKTFAAQAVIAIENVRLFKELQQRTDALTKSVGQLTALGEVGQAISSTLDLDKVLPTIVSRAVQLTGLDGGAIYEYDEAHEVFSMRAGENVRQEILELDRSEPIRIGDGAIGRAAATRQPVQVPDIAAASGRQTRGRDVLLQVGARALLAVPLLREGHILGALAVIRNTPGEFPPEVVALLETFATQSAIAIQNARLFREIEDKSRQLEEASEHKSQFLASMSHELRTPLNAILGLNEMMLGEIYGEVPEEMRPPLAQTQASGKHLLSLINNVLDLAKIEANRMELALAAFVVQDLVASVRATLEPLAREKGLEFVASAPDDLPLAYGDAGRLTQCLINLAGNSIKFTKQGGVAINVEAAGEALRFSVADTGIGIAPDKIESLFTEFKQTDATIASEYGGTGLGLAITKKFVEMHGGRIWVESEPSKGSVFIFEVPLRTETT